MSWALLFSLLRTGDSQCCLHAVRPAPFQTSRCVARSLVLVVGYDLNPQGPFCTPGSRIPSVFLSSPSLLCSSLFLTRLSRLVCRACWHIRIHMASHVVGLRNEEAHVPWGIYIPPPPQRIDHLHIHPIAAGKANEGPTWTRTRRALRTTS